ncbi:MAG: RNA 2',3'-cyclic phosphodiesterase [Firmicutes bacterium]|nr:RNA 2',3'-cyclic phosphodiesterase [Bacillota bacterium]
MDLFLVARPTGRLLSLAAEVQETLNKRYKLYAGHLPPLHITLARVQFLDSEERGQALERTAEAARKTGSFLVQANGYLCFGPPHLAIGAAVVGDENLFRLRADLVTHLAEQLFVLPNDYWKPHITLVSATHGRPWSEQEWKAAYHEVLDYPLQAECLIEELELWYPQFDPSVRMLAKFRLGFGLVELLD